MNTSTPGMEFLSDAFFLLKKASATSQWNLIFDRNDRYWSGFRSTHHWDTYDGNDESGLGKYDVNCPGVTMYLNYYSHGNINLCGQGGSVGIGGNPSYPFHILSSGLPASTHSHYGIYQSPGSYMSGGGHSNKIGIGATSGFYTNTYIAMKVDYGIWTTPEFLRTRMRRRKTLHTPLLSSMAAEVVTVTVVAGMRVNSHQQPQQQKSVTHSHRNRHPFLSLLLPRRRSCP